MTVPERIAEYLKNHVRDAIYDDCIKGSGHGSDHIVRRHYQPWLPLVDNGGVVFRPLYVVPP